MTLFLLLNTIEDILKNVDNQTVSVPIDFFVHAKNQLEPKLLVYQPSSKYLLIIQVWNDMKVSK